MPSSRITIAVAICTYNRNDALISLLESLVVSAAHVAGRAAIGVVVVDDSRDERARAVVSQYENTFELGIAYCYSGRQNISVARNTAIDAASKIAEWTAMIDDDCEAKEEWFEALLDTQAQTGATAVTGTMIRRIPAGSPRWLTEEPFLDVGLPHLPDQAQMTVAATFNSMISSRWLREHPDIRFSPDLGVLGGEDMVFYHRAHAAGLRIHFSDRAAVFENQPPSRTTIAYQLRSFFWLGNSSYVTSVRNGVHPLRMFLHGVHCLLKAIIRPFCRMVRGSPPQLRYCLALILNAFGKMVGPFGIRVNH